ncbi:IgGFc-binding protein-like [Sardina pilchardus]|uniref:IgGFc-binding protein-like n=1 Tax=Sardina pilchardus TaxID=27697 RepID=UPI002E15663F
MGDPHYRSFDGNYFSFMGNCSYILAKNCDVDESTPTFEVSVKNEKSAKSLLTAVGNITIKVFDQVIQMVRSEISMVRVNYEVWNLPVTLKTPQGELKMVQSGLSVIFWTDFGLSVQYDWEEYVKITLPTGLMSKVCGMCGNFDGNKNNDLVTQDGTKANSIEEFGKSWMVPDQKGAQYCQNQCTEECEGCSFLKAIGANLFCGVMTPILDIQFKGCHSVIEPSVFFDMCKFDHCRGGDMKDYICDMLQVYTDACQRAGVNVPDWRHLAHCPTPACPENSHFEYCGDACPATCEDPSAPSSCKTPCVQTCACDEGYFRSGNKCIRKEECGCQFNGRFVQPGETFWGDVQCTQRLFCSMEGELNTETTNCPEGQGCDVVGGVRDCYPVHYGTCLVSGDPHYLTFDGEAYDFQGTCVYQLAGLCSEQAGLESFDITVQNSGRNKQMGSSTKLVEVQVYGYTIVISQDTPSVVTVNGEIQNLPVNLDSNKVLISKSGFFAVVETDFKMKLSYDWNSVVMVTLPSTYMGAMCGLCGNFNANVTDDMRMKNGQVAKSGADMGQSWRVAEIPGCLDACNGTCPDCDLTQKILYETNDYCGLLNNHTGPFRECMDVIDPSSFYQSCLYDLCLHQGKGSMQCKTLTAYTAACQAKGITVYPWRSAALCTDQCGCQYKGKYYQPNKAFYPDGLCAEECICNGTAVSCKVFSCGANEKCDVKNGVRACQAIGQGVCSISGDPHYNTFDNATYNFMGTCTYTVAEGCHLDGTQLTNFSVVVENEKWYDMSEDPNVSVAKLVAVTVYGYTIILRRGQIGLAMVDGAIMNIPLTIDDGLITLKPIGDNYVISTDFGLKVTYDLVYHVTVTVPGNYRDKTCGLCGNFNGNKNDEFQLPDGQSAKDVTTFGAAWKVGVEGVVCDDGCVGDSCPECPANEAQIIESDCSIITNPKGPFAACQAVLDPEPYYRDCIYDVCIAGSNGTKMLCHSINAYVLDCQDTGVKVLNWRSSRFCPMACPSNSHYEDCALPCQTPCPGLTSITCADTCAEGCACNSGYYFNGTGCVPEDQCSCYINGQTIKIGETIVTQNCEEKYICQKSGVVLTEHMSCNIDENCEVQNGVRGCYPKQCVMGSNGGLTTFNGLKVQATASGTYDLVKVCDDTQTDGWFRVAMDLQACGNSSQVSAVGIFVFFDSAFIIINSKFAAMVNGRMQTLPIQLTNGVSIKVTNDMLVIEKPSAVVVSYSRSHQITVTVSDSVAANVCGACGKLTEAASFTESAAQSYLNGYRSPIFNFCN